MMGQGPGLFDKLADISAGAKRLTGARQYYDAYRPVLVTGGDRLQQLLHHLPIQGIVPIGSVQGNGGHRAFDRVHQRVIGHAASAFAHAMGAIDAIEDLGEQDPPARPRTRCCEGASGARRYRDCTTRKNAAAVPIIKVETHETSMRASGQWLRMATLSIAPSATPNGSCHLHVRRPSRMA